MKVTNKDMVVMVIVFFQWHNCKAFAVKSKAKTGKKYYTKKKKSYQLSYIKIVSSIPSQS